MTSLLILGGVASAALLIGVIYAIIEDWWTDRHDPPSESGIGHYRTRR